jgi:hypothetical protein
VGTLKGHQDSAIPFALRDHSFEWLAERKITAEDLYQLKLWRESEPDAPEGAWYKDFGSFKICGEGKYPKTFLLMDSPPEIKSYNVQKWGAELDWLNVAAN